jgi:hypothetical protein
LPAVGELGDQGGARGRQRSHRHTRVGGQHIDLGPCVLAQRVTSTPAFHGACGKRTGLQTIQALAVIKTGGLRHQIIQLIHAISRVETPDSRHMASVSSLQIYQIEVFVKITTQNDATNCAFRHITTWEAVFRHRDFPEAATAFTFNG